MKRRNLRVVKEAVITPSQMSICTIYICREEQEGAEEKEERDTQEEKADT